MLRTTTRTALTATLVACLTVAGAARADWNVAVGGDPARDGRAEGVGPTAPELLWQGSLSAIVAQQAVIGDGLVVVNRIESFTIPTGTWIVAHELAGGAIRWQVQLPALFPDSWRSRVTGLRDGRVYATRAGNTNAEYLYALSPADGEILWRSEALVTETTTESVAFTADGDVLTTGVDGAGATVLHRIAAVDGTTVWSAPRSCPTSGGCDAAVFGDRAYVFEASPFGPVITAFDTVTGARLYSTESLTGGLIQQIAPFVGPDGTVYAPRAANNPETDFLVALEDTGAGFAERWRAAMGYAPFASHAVGPDGTVYGYSPEKEVMRLDPATGAVLDRSFPIPNDGTLQARMAVDDSGKLFLTNGSFDSGELFAFSPELHLIWRDPILNVNVGGPALASDGTLVVCGTGTDVRAYRTDCAGYFAAYGSGCAGSGELVPTLAGSGCPSPGGAIEFLVADALGGADALLVVGGGTDPLPLTGSCELAIAPLTGRRLPVDLSPGGPGEGSGTAGVVLPADLGTTDGYVQVIVRDPGAPGGAAATAPLQVHVEGP